MQLWLASKAIGLLYYLSLTAAQTYTDCNPLQQTCPADKALGSSQTYDFTKGASSDFTAVGSPTYGNDGIGFTVAKQGDSPLIKSNWYIMFGHVEFVIKAAPGVGIVSSAVLQSDDLDEIDWEWLGGNNQLVQSNYFGKGNTDSFNRGATHDNPGNHDGFYTYSIEWTSSQVVWQIDGKTVRVLTPETAANNQYPQTPMMVKVGVWAGGDPNNAQGTIQWAGGVTDYSAGPYTMYMKSLKVVDYSTGSSYTYSDTSGSWQSIRSEGGEINGNIGAEALSSVESAPTITATVDSGPIPFGGTHRETSSFVTPDVYPWVPRPTTDDSQSPSTSLPDGWTFAGSGRPQPPGRTSMSEHCPNSRFVRSSNLPLKCVFPSQSTSRSTSAFSRSPSALSSLSAHDPSQRTHSTVHFNTKLTGQSKVTTPKRAYPSDIPQFPLASALHATPSIDGANSMYGIPFTLGVLGSFLGSSMVLF